MEKKAEEFKEFERQEGAQQGFFCYVWVLTSGEFQRSRGGFGWEQGHMPSMKTMSNFLSGACGGGSDAKTAEILEAHVVSAFTSF